MREIQSVRDSGPRSAERDLGRENILAPYNKEVSSSIRGIPLKERAGIPGPKEFGPVAIQELMYIFWGTF